MLDELRKIAGEITKTGYLQYDIYNIIVRAFLFYRGYTMVGTPMAKEEIQKNLQFDNYVKIECKTRGEAPVMIVLLNSNDKGSNEIISSIEKWRMFVNAVYDKKLEKLIVISPGELSNSVIKHIAEEGDGYLTALNIFKYDHFKIITPLGPGVPEHRILTADETKEIMSYHGLQPANIKQLYYNDAQNIWLGGEVGDYVLITRASAIAGKSTDLRRIIPGTGV